MEVHVDTVVNKAMTKKLHCSRLKNLSVKEKSFGVCMMEMYCTNAGNACRARDLQMQEAACTVEAASTTSGFTQRRRQRLRGDVEQHRARLGELKERMGRTKVFCKLAWKKLPSKRRKLPKPIANSSNNKYKE